MNEPTKMYRDIVAQVPQLRRGSCWCRTCGRHVKVNAGNSLANGWPKCCGYTMTIDSPEEQKRLAQR